MSKMELYIYTLFYRDIIVVNGIEKENVERNK